MRAKKNDGRGLAEGGSRLEASPPEGRREDRENLGDANTGACPAAHERAVVTVRLTLLLVIVGAALFLFGGAGGGVPSRPDSGGAVERLK